MQTVSGPVRYQAQWEPSHRGQRPSRGWYVGAAPASSCSSSSQLHSCSTICCWPLLVSTWPKWTIILMYIMARMLADFRRRGEPAHDLMNDESLCVRSYSAALNSLDWVLGSFSNLDKRSKRHAIAIYELLFRCASSPWVVSRKRREKVYSRFERSSHLRFHSRSHFSLPLANQKSTQ